MDRRICEAIRNRNHLAFNYNGFSREIEPHAHGISSQGKEVVRGYQSGGQSSSGELGWRLFDVAKMESLRVCRSTFANARPGYVRGDSRMQSVHCEL